VETYPCGPKLVPNMKSVKLGTCKYNWGNFVHFGGDSFIIPSSILGKGTLQSYIYLSKLESGLSGRGGLLGMCAIEGVGCQVCVPLKRRVVRLVIILSKGNNCWEVYSQGAKL